MTTKTEKATYSAGNGITTESIEHNGKNGFAIYNLKSGSCTYAESLGSILPKQVVPWLPPEIPVEYGNPYNL